MIKYLIYSILYLVAALLGFFVSMESDTIYYGLVVVGIILSVQNLYNFVKTKSVIAELHQANLFIINREETLPEKDSLKFLIHLRALTSIIAGLIGADGKVDDTEKALYWHFLLELEMEKKYEDICVEWLDQDAQRVLQREMDINYVVRIYSHQIETTEEKEFLITILLTFAFIDDDFDEKEKELIYEIGDKLDLKDERIDMLIDEIEREMDEKEKDEVEVS